MNINKVFSSASRNICSPKVAGALGIAVALFQLCLAIEDFRKNREPMGFRPSKK